MMYYAHSVSGYLEEGWQTLPEHSRAVADRAANFGGRFGLGEAGRIAGLLHDLGKYCPEFQARLRGSLVRVEHSIAGAQVIRVLVAARVDSVIAELIAYAIAGHHAGLPDRIGDGSSLDARLAKFDPSELDPIWQSDLGMGAIPDLTPPFARRGGPFAAFRLALLGRMIFSCLVDADFKDTEAFYCRAEGRAVDRDWPKLQDLLPSLVQRFDAHMAAIAARADGSDVNRLRSAILGHVRGRAAEPPGLFTLTVPTGGGKTLASLGFALDHAALHGLDRIIYAIPYTSITEQTAAIFREVLGDAVVLEHHSTFDEMKLPSAKAADMDRAGRDKLKLAMEDWAAPVVVTTTVQLFESLFAARTGRSRKLHNIARSVIVLDEAQVLPRPFMAPIVRAIHELAESYGCTVVLCTATQPAFDARHFPPPKPGKPPHPLALPLEGRELAPDPADLARRLKRVRLHFASEMTNADLVAALEATSQGLVIVNSRAHALELYQEAVAAGLEGVVHLTTRQYAAHRREILAGVRVALKDRKPCRVIATSLVEAGVDLDFPAVWRAEAGLDSVAQAAGRCNREGERDPEASLVTVFKPVGYATPREIAGLVGDFARMAEKHDDLLSPAAFADYFGEMYWRVGEGIDRERILDKFGVDATGTNFAYRTVGEAFRMIESGLLPVIIERDDAAKKAVADLSIPGFSSGNVARRLQGYVVQVPPKARALLMAAGHVKLAAESLRGDQFAVLRAPGLYKDDVGLIWEDAAYLSLDNTFV